MKKFAGIMVATVLAFSLVACGPVDSAVQNLAGAASNQGSGVVTADDDGYAEGRIGDVMRTYFFDYTVARIPARNLKDIHLQREISFWWQN